MLSRRSFLSNTALFGGVAVGSMLPPSIEKALAITPDPGTTYLDAEHIVILMQENRSFDHMFGTMRGVRGFADRRTMRHGDGGSVFLQRDGEGRGVLPWHASLKDSRFTWLGSVPHDRTSHLDAWNGGACNNWVTAKQSKNYPDIPLAFGYHTREDVPFYYALADAFTVCDQYFASGLTETTPNRLFLFSGNLREKNAHGSLPYLKNPSTHPGGLDWTSFPERLERAGLSWRVYQNDSWSESPNRLDPAFQWYGNSGDNTLERFRAMKPGFTAEYRAYADGLLDGYNKRLRARKAELEASVAALAPAIEDIGTTRHWIAAYDAQIDRLEKKGAHGRSDSATRTPAEEALHSKVFTSNRHDPDFGKMETLTYVENGVEKSQTVPAGDLFYQLRQDVRDNKLPTVSWLVTPTNFSAHPSVPFYGASYVSELMDVLTENPEVWKKTIFLLTYDENDGFFDHVAPFAACDPQRPETGKASEGLDPRPEYAYKEEERLLGTPEPLVRDGPIGMGFRVPMIVASPWSRGGWVNSEVSEHSSVIRFLEHFLSAKYGKAVKQEEISEWRRAVSGNLTSCFRPFDGEGDALPFMDRDAHIVDIELARAKPLPVNFDPVAVADYRGKDAEQALLGERLWQEPGSKRSCALPYELSVHGQLSADGQFFQLSLTADNKRFGPRAAGAPFNVCLRGVSEGSQQFVVDGASSDIWVANYAVKAGDTLTDLIALDRFAGDRYEIEVFGPNGFYRQFVGSRSGALPAVACRPVAGSAPGLVLLLANNDKADVELELRANDYVKWRKKLRLRPGKTASLSFPVDAGQPWYDLAIVAGGGEEPIYQAAGRVESGAPSISDPAIARGRPKRSVAPSDLRPLAVEG